MNGGDDGSTINSVSSITCDLVKTRKHICISHYNYSKYLEMSLTLLTTLKLLSLPLDLVVKEAPLVAVCTSIAADILINNFHYN